MATTPGTTDTRERTRTDLLVGLALGGAFAVASLLQPLAGVFLQFLELLGFWSAVVLPLVAVGVLTVQPQGWLPIALGLFALDGVAMLVGHCHGMEC